jgi:tetratricopeptide (TPR) repeat protein
LGLVYFALGLNCIVAGDLDAAVDAAEHARRIGTSLPDPRLIAGAGYTAAWVHVLRGDYDEGVHTARQAIEASRDRTAESLASGALGLAYLERGDAAAAIPLLRRAVDQLADIPLRQGVVRHLVYLSEAYLLNGELERARQTAREAAVMGESSRNAYNAGLTGRVLGRISRHSGDLARARAQLATALTAFAACGATFEAARTRLDLAAVLAAQGDRAGAVEQLAMASRAFAAASAPRRVAETAELSRRLGVGRPASVGA